MMTRQEIAELELIAQHADDPTAYRREMAEVRRLKAKHGHSRATLPATHGKAERRPTGGRVASSINHAIQMMEGKA